MADPDAPLSQRLRASALLAKSEGDFWARPEWESSSD